MKENPFPGSDTGGKKNPVQSYTTKNTNHNIAIVGNKIKLPKLGLVKFKQTRALEGRMMRATIHYHASGRFSVSITCEVPEFQPLPKTHQAIGIDLGIKEFAILSNGSIYKNINKSQEIKQLGKKVPMPQQELTQKEKIIKYIKEHIIFVVICLVAIILISKYS